MEREIKDQLKSVYEAPPPLHKKEFMQKWNRPQMNIWEVMRSQAAYIRKWIWALSAVIFMVTVIGAVTAAANLMWVLSALTPFLAVTVIAECGRSEQYEMAELEMATRFSLRSVLFARLWILGVENAMLLWFLVIAGIWRGDRAPFQTGMYILTPYLLTSFIGLCIARVYKGREAIYFCAGAAAAIGSFVFMERDVIVRTCEGYSTVTWGCMMALLAGCVIRQYRNMIIGLVKTDGKI